MNYSIIIPWTARQLSWLWIVSAFIRARASSTSCANRFKIFPSTLCSWQNRLSNLHLLQTQSICLYNNWPCLMTKRIHFNTSQKILTFWILPMYSNILEISSLFPWVSKLVHTHRVICLTIILLKIFFFILRMWNSMPNWRLNWIHSFNFLSISI